MNITCEACRTNFDAPTELADSAACPCCEHVNRPRERTEKIDTTPLSPETTAAGGDRQPKAPAFRFPDENRKTEAAERASRAMEAAESEIRAAAAERASRAMEAAESEIRAAAAEAASRAAEAGEVTRPRPKGRKRAAAPVVRLTVAEEGQLPRQYVVDRERVVLGRGKCDIKVSDPEVSREHCAIETRDGVATLRDLKSANGTVLNGHLVNEHALKDGDRIAIGTTVVEISVAKAA
jgi:hypothetical protein